jgi:hypothetical protein
MHDIHCEIETNLRKTILKNSHKNQTSTEPKRLYQRERAWLPLNLEEAMFKLLKWAVISMLVIAIWYGVSLFLSLDKEEKIHVKKEAIEAIDSGDTQPLLTGHFSERMKADLQQKKSHVIDVIKQKLKNVIDKLMDI